MISNTLRSLLIEADAHTRNLQRKVQAGNATARELLRFRLAVVGSDKSARHYKQVADRAYRLLVSRLVREFPDKAPPSALNELSATASVAFRRYTQVTAALRQKLVKQLDAVYDDMLARESALSVSRDMYDLIEQFFNQVADTEFLRLVDAITDSFAARVGSADEAWDLILYLARSGSIYIPWVLPGNEGHVSERVSLLAKALRALDNALGANYAPKTIKMLAAAMKQSSLFIAELNDALARAALDNDEDRDDALFFMRSIRTIQSLQDSVQRSISLQRMAYKDLLKLREAMSRAVQAVKDEVEIGSIGLSSVKRLQRHFNRYDIMLGRLVEFASKRGGRL